MSRQGAGVAPDAARKERIRMKRYKWLSVLVVMLALAFPILQGCASQQETKTVEQPTTTNNPEPPKSTTTTTITRTETSEQQPDSILGATVHAVGTVILFPFRLVGDALGLIV
jgi:uncharacterized lipoprotein YajG